MKRLLTALICIALIVCLLASCSSSPSPDKNRAEIAAPSVSESSYSFGGYEAGYDSGDYKYGGYNDNESAIPIPILTPSASGKKMVYTVGLSLQTTDFHAGMRKLLDTVDEMGGYVESASITGRDLRYPNMERRAGYTFRVPSERLAEFLVIAQDNYNLLSLQQDSQNYTAKYEQTDTRLTDLTEQEKRLREDLEKAVSTNERLSLERRLAEVQASISGLNSSQSSIDDSVLYSTVKVLLYEVILPKDSESEISFGERLGKRIADSAEGFVLFCQNFLLLVVTLAPAVLVVLIVAAAALPIVKLVNKQINMRKVIQTESAARKPGVKNEENK